MKVETIRDYTGNWITTVYSLYTDDGYGSIIGTYPTLEDAKLYLSEYEEASGVIIVVERVSTKFKPVLENWDMLLQQYEYIDGNKLGYIRKD